jgi:hypothetical protein
MLTHYEYLPYRFETGDVKILIDNQRRIVSFATNFQTNKEEKDRYAKMMNIDVDISDNVNSLNEDIDGSGSSTNGDNDNADTDAPGIQCLLLEFLPRDLLTGSILTSYLDGNSLANFWCTTMSKHEMILRRSSPKGKTTRGGSLSSPSFSSQPSSMVEEILQIIRRRRGLLTEEEGTFENSGIDNERYGLHRQVFQAFEEAINESPADTASSDSEPDKNIAGSDESTTHQEHQDKNNDSFFNFKEFLRFSRRTFGNLSAMDYCERVPHNLIWCGYLRVVDRQQWTTDQSEDQQQPIKVALVVHPRRWSMKEIRLWRNATTWSTSRRSGPVAENKSRQPTVKATVIPHNFLPVGPNRGRFVGFAESDRMSLRKISDRLNQSELVGRFSCMIASVAPPDVTNTDAGAATNAGFYDHGGQFTVKLMNFAQAQRRMNGVFRQGYEPGGIPLSDEKAGMVLHPASGCNDSGSGNEMGVDHDRNSLLCCWNHEFLWEDSRAFRMETSYALRDTMKEYDRLSTMQ